MNIEYRHPTEADLVAITEVSNRGTGDMTHHIEMSIETVRENSFDSEDFDPAGFLLAFANGVPVAYGGSMISRSRFSSGMKDANVQIFILPEWRGRGIEDRLFDSAIEYIRSRGAGCARFWAPGPSGWRNDFALKHGMRDIRHGYILVYDGGTKPPEVPLPEGYRLSRMDLQDMTDEEISDHLAAFNDTFADHWNFAPIPLDKFLKARDTETFRKELVSMFSAALGGDSIVGVCLFEMDLRYNQQNNAKAGWLEVLGVRKGHRCLGLGRALLSDAMNWLWGRGMETLYLGLDAENRRALDLYISLGFRVDDETVTYELKL